MRKMFHDELSFVSTNVSYEETWSNNKHMTDPKTSEFNIGNFITAGKTCLTRVLLETERSFF